MKDLKYVCSLCFKSHLRFYGPSYYASVCMRTAAYGSLFVCLSVCLCVCVCVCFTAVTTQRVKYKCK